MMDVVKSGVLQGQLQSNVLFNGYPDVNSLQLDDIRVMGIITSVVTVTVNGLTIDSWTQDSSTKVS